MTHGVNDHRRPDDWQEALIAGDGRQGALVYGGPAALRVTISHERLFLPVDEPLAPPNTAAVLDRLRGLCLDGRFQDAADAVVEKAKADDARYETLRWIDPFIGAATLTFTPDEPGGYWHRELDFGTGIVTQGTDALRQEVFVSRADDVVAVTLTGDVRGRLTLHPIDGGPPMPIAFITTTARDALRLEATWPGGGYTTIAKVVDAEVDPSGRLDTTHATILVRTTPANAAPAPLPRIVRRDQREHAELMARCTLELPDDPETERLFAAGRYAIISATGDLPPNLQGVWSGSYDPPWRSGYTMDGNLAAAVAGLGPTGTPELLLPVFDLLEAHLDDFRANARRLWGAPGIVLPPHLSTNGRHNHFGPKWCLTFWTGGAGWAARLYYDYWRYTGDDAFYRQRAIPFMREAMEFYRHILVERSGKLLLVPSYSPENSPSGDEGPQASINATHEIAVIRDLARNLGDLDLVERLPPYEVGPDGCLREWLWPGLPDHHEHRHSSHLYGLWYEPDPVFHQPSLKEAALNTIRTKLDWWAQAGDEMAFGLVQLGLAAAALGAATEAAQALRRLHAYWRPSLVPTHNVGAIFNTDIAGGLPALVVAMLVAGGDDTVHVLPACPPQWRRGRLEGAFLRGGIRIDRLEWSPGRVDLRLTRSVDGPVTASLRGEQAQIGEGRELNFTWCSDGREGP